MLKKTLLFLLSLTLILMLPSCDLMKGNKFIELGLLDYQSPEVDALIKDIDEGFTASKPTGNFYDSTQSGETVTVDITKLDGFSGLFGFTEANLKIDKKVAESISANGMLKPSENPEELRSMVNKAVDGTANKDLLNKALGQPSNQSVQAHNSVALIASALGTSLEDNLGSSLEDTGLPAELTDAIETMIKDLNKKAEAPENELTKAEVLQVQLITNFVVSVSNVTNPDESEGGGGDLTIDSPEIQSLVNEAIVLSKYTESIKGIDMIRVPSSDLLSDYITDNGGSVENGGEENVEA